MQIIRPESPDFFVIGNPKSGTTWLMECLNLHPETYCFNEINFMGLAKDGIAGVLQHLNSCYLQGHQTTFHEFDYFDLQFKHEDVDLLLNTLWKIAIQKVQKDAKFYGEKCPSYSTILPTLIDQYQDAKFVHIVRDPRDVAISYWYHHLREWDLYKNSQWYRGIEKNLPTQLVENEHNKVKDQPTAIFDSITRWKRDQTMVESTKKRFPEKFYTIRYEDMKNIHDLQNIFKFLGCEKHNDILVKNILLQTDVDIRTKSTNSFFKFAKSGNWHELDDSIKDFMNSQLGDWLPVYGYESV